MSHLQTTLTSSYFALHGEGANPCHSNICFRFYGAFASPLCVCVCFFFFYLLCFSFNVARGEDKVSMQSFPFRGMGKTKNCTGRNLTATLNA